MAHGGYRAPAEPAPVSGPGALSKRTDGVSLSPQVTGLAYGTNGSLNEMAASAPMAQPRPNVVPLDAPSQNPMEPVTAGVSVGPGPGPSVLSMPMAGTLSERLARLLGDDASGEIEELLLFAERYGL
jgi:hypothetical protein